MASEEVNAILGALMPLAEQLLRKNGEFFPLGGTLSVDGKVSLIQPMAEIERPPSQELIDLIVAGFISQAKASEITASGICYDSKFRISEDAKPTDAICCRLESNKGEAVVVYLPYKLKKQLFKREHTLSTENLVAVPGEPQIFEIK